MGDAYFAISRFDFDVMQMGSASERKGVGLYLMKNGLGETGGQLLFYSQPELGFALVQRRWK